ncbi:hypothetical protein BJ742DRAFT_835290 [Cladochytrium replicatum]|nr:hypothetical protein BJ742DRAFT_835290 [Cladochytrium replicatum]
MRLLLFAFLVSKVGGCKSDSPKLLLPRRRARANYTSVFFLRSSFLVARWGSSSRSNSFVFVSEPDSPKLFLSSVRGLAKIAPISCFGYLLPKVG